MSAIAARPRRIPRAALLTAALLAAALVAWLVTLDQMWGMDAGPGTDPGGLAWYLGAWVTMMAAMMIPSAIPMVLLFSKVNSQRAAKGGRSVPTPVFVTGYLLAWTAYGALAYGMYRAAASLEWSVLSWDRGGQFLAAGAVGAAAVYQLSPLKAVCLKHCRGPMHFLMGGWRDGYRGALRMGIEHGGYCVGCCWGLMLVLWAIGVMSVTWMIVVAILILLEKASPIGDRLPPVLAAAFAALALWIAIAPGTVPALNEPAAGAGAMDEMNRMK